MQMNIPATFDPICFSGSIEEDWNVYGQTTDDGRQVMAIDHMTLRVRWAKNEHSCMLEFLIYSICVLFERHIFCYWWASPWERLCPTPCRSFPLLSWGKAYTKRQQALQKMKLISSHSGILMMFCPSTIQTLLVGFHIPQSHFLTCTSKFTATVFFLSDSINKETTLICHYIYFFYLKRNIPTAPAYGV